MVNFFEVITDLERSLPVYLIELGYHWEQEHVHRPAGFSRLQWVLCKEGEGTLVIHGEEYNIKKGDGMLLEANVPHEYFSIRKAPFRTNWIVMDGYLSDQFIGNTMHGSGVYQMGDLDQCESYFKQLMEIHEKNDTDKPVSYSKCLYSLLTDLSFYAKQKDHDNRRGQQVRLKPVFRYIEEHCGRVILLDELSKILHVTPEHFCRIFKQSTGLIVSEYINSVRIRHAKEFLLLHIVMPVKEIAVLCGFGDFSYFCAVFKRYELMTPGQFRKERLQDRKKDDNMIEQF